MILTKDYYDWYDQLTISFPKLQENANSQIN
jgi:hypothetical protein